MPPDTPSGESAPRGETAHQRRRRERAEARADKLARRADAQHDAARAEVAQIPMGQPVLRGHHSEAKHRRALDRSNRKAQAALETSRAMERAAATAVRAGRSVSSDDPEALDALRAQLEEMEAKREAAKRHNREAKKTGGDTLPSYYLRNLGARIRRIKQRIAEIEAASEREGGVLHQGDGWVIEDDPAANRIRVVHDSKPDADTRAMLKREGFRWARSVGAWQRMSNAAGRAAAERVAAHLRGES